jgi:hypothetical protein
MKTFICLCVLAFVTLHYSVGYGQTPKNNDLAAVWEFKILSNPSEEILNLSTKEGWDIVTSAGGGGDGGFFKVIMKRHKSHPLFGTKISVYKKADPPPQISSCKLTLAQAPVIRGLCLGMTSEELFTFFPGNERQEFDRKEQFKRAELAPFYGYTSFNLSANEFSTTDRFKGISHFQFGLLDRKLVYIDLRYENTPQFDTMEQLMEVITRQLGLPAYKEWSGYQKYGTIQSIGCDGFIINVHGISNSFSIQMIDQSYEKIRNDRRQADLAKKREGFKL